jgi:phytoene dehydrogenase-like protein
VGVRLADGDVIHAKTAVIGQIHPWLLGDLVDGLDPIVLGNARRTQTASFGITVSHFALNAPPQYIAGSAAGSVALVNFAPSRLEDYRRIFDDFRYGDLSAHTMLAAHDNAQFDPTRAPAGKSALTVFGFAPFHLREGGSAAWDRIKDSVAQRTLDEFRRYVTNMDDSNIMGRHYDSPLDVLRHSPTWQGADVGGVGKYLYQIGGHRPTPELSQYAVPGVDGLYLAGTFMHPPGGVTGGGRATAIKICGDLDIDFDSLVT